MIRRTLVLPAAGTGSRLRSPLPKLLHPVAGRPMLAHLVALYRPWIDRWHLVVRPADREAIAAACLAVGLDAMLHEQAVPTGMLDAVLQPHDAIAAERPDEVWITWCDQVALRPATIARLAGRDSGEAPALRLATCHRRDPYIHLDRDAAGRIVNVRHRREGDAMPEVGESDAGVFVLRGDVYVDALPRFASEPAPPGAHTAERNFLPFLAWLGAGARVASVPCEDDAEAIGINTPGDLAAIEAVLAGR